MGSRRRFSWKYQLSSSEVLLLLLFVILLLPTYASLRLMQTSLVYSVESLLWRLLFYRDGSISFRVVPAFLDLLGHLLKYLLVIQYHRYNRHATTKKRVLALAILSELQIPILIDIPLIIQAILGIHPWGAFIWYIPIPSVLIVTILFLMFVPRPESEPMWIDKEEKRSWWD